MTSIIKLTKNLDVVSDSRNVGTQGIQSQRWTMPESGSRERSGKQNSGTILVSRHKKGDRDMASLRALRPTWTWGDRATHDCRDAGGRATQETKPRSSCRDVRGRVLSGTRTGSNAGARLQGRSTGDLQGCRELEPRQEQRPRSASVTRGQEARAESNACSTTTRM